MEENAERPSEAVARPRVTPNRDRRAEGSGTRSSARPQGGRACDRSGSSRLKGHSDFIREAQPLSLASYRPALHLTKRAFCVVRGRGCTDVAGGCTSSAKMPRMVQINGARSLSLPKVEGRLRYAGRYWLALAVRLARAPQARRGLPPVTRVGFSCGQALTPTCRLHQRNLHSSK